MGARNKTKELAILAWGLVLTLAAADYQRPPKNVLEILDAPLPPQVSISPSGQHLLLTQSERYPPIADLAEPMLRLAGLRINPQTNGPHSAARMVRMSLQSIDSGKTVDLKVPERARLGTPAWSPDGTRFAFSHTTPARIELWVGDVASGSVRALPGITLNAAYGSAYRWMPGSKELFCKTLPAERGAPPTAIRVPKGPVIQESSGRPAPVRTYQDLLQNPQDEEILDYYATSQLTLVDVTSDKKTPIGRPAIIAAVSAAPDGQHFIITRNRRPYSYLVPATSFPKDVEVWNRKGDVVTKVASLPSAEHVPIEGVLTGPRDYQWMPSQPATLIWVEALDGGDPKKKVPHRDEMKQLRIGEATPKSIGKTEHRFAGLTWSEDGDAALLRDYDREKRRRRTFVVSKTDPDFENRKLLWDLSINERYKDPGSPVTKTLPSGQQVLRVQDGCILLDGNGATPTGNRPFLDKLDLKTQKAARLFHSAENCLESVVGVLADDGSRFITQYQTPSEPPNYHLRTAQGDKQPLTKFTDPCPQLRGIKKQLVKYKRADGVPLSFTLYLPPGYQEGQRLPAVVWAYPLEFLDADTAGQVTGSPHRFTTISGTSHLFFLLQGYAVLDGASLPVIGDPEKVNDTFIDQVVSGAKAAIDKADEMGVIDRNRVGVGGHSYGAFMTANLLAHSDLFRAGIAQRRVQPHAHAVRIPK